MMDLQPLQHDYSVVGAWHKLMQDLPHYHRRDFSEKGNSVSARQSIWTFDHLTALVHIGAFQEITATSADLLFVFQSVADRNPEDRHRDRHDRRC